MDLMYLQYIVPILVTLGTSVVTLFTGFGFGTIMMPVMALFFDVKVAIFLAIYALLSLIPNSIKLELPNRVDFIGGLLSGLIGGLIGNQGAIGSLYLLKYEMRRRN